MNKFEHGIKQIFEHLPIEIFPTKGITALFREEPKFASLSLFLLMEFPLADKHARIVQLRAQIKMLCDLQRNNVKCTTKAAALRMRVGQAASP